MRNSTTRSEGMPEGGSDPFAFPQRDAMMAGANQMALMWTIPLRAMMVVMTEAMHRR
ncbi:MAG: hypothetical protein AAFR52_15310 [Pseudomonadota bacterium]